MNNYMGNELYILPSDYVLLDIEKTGLEPRNAEITEIAAYKIKDNKVVDSFQSLIKPNNPIPEEITRLTHITNEMVKDADPVEIVLGQFKEFVGNDIIMGHNVRFDIGFLTHYSYICFSEYLLNDFVDTLRIARKVLGYNVPNHKLETLSLYYGLDTSGEHRALKDVELTYTIYNKLKEAYDEKGI